MWDNLALTLLFAILLAYSESQNEIPLIIFFVNSPYFFFYPFVEIFKDIQNYKEFIKQCIH